MRYAASIPLTIKTPKGVLDIRAGQPFKVANNEFLLGLIKEGKVRPVQDIIKEEYLQYTKRLNELPELDMSAWPDLNQEIQAATGKLNEAKESEDLSGFTEAKERALSLYMQAVAYADPHSVAVKMWSEVLQCFLWVVPDRDEAKALRDSGALDVVYTHDEIRALKGSTPEHLRAVHAARLEFPDSTVIDSRPRRTAAGTTSTADMPVMPKKEQGGALPCLVGDSFDYGRWHSCKTWDMKHHADSRRLQRVCKASGQWCKRLYQDGDTTTIEA